MQGRVETEQEEGAYTSPRLWSSEIVLGMAAALHHPLRLDALGLLLKVVGWCVYVAPAPVRPAHSYSTSSRARLVVPSDTRNTNENNHPSLLRRYSTLSWRTADSLVGSYHSRYKPFTKRTVTADFPTPPQPITAHCRVRSPATACMTVLS